jgi:hypothetical protein
MKITKTFVALSSLLAVAVIPAQAGTKTFQEVVVVEEAPAAWGAELSTGLDSLYMFRGVNVLRSAGNGGTTGGYGGGLQWTNLDITYNLSENDSLTLTNWFGYGIARDLAYREYNLALGYAHTIDALTLGLGYTFYVVQPQLYANELNVSAAYDLDLGFMALTPSLTYYYNLGPNSNHQEPVSDAHYGLVRQGSSYLDIRLDGSIAVSDAISIDPWVATGLNFRFNSEGPGVNAFNGFNHVELGLAVPYQVNDTITISGYIAYSIAFNDLQGLQTDTSVNTIYGGGSVSFAF